MPDKLLLEGCVAVPLCCLGRVWDCAKVRIGMVIGMRVEGEKGYRVLDEKVKIYMVHFECRRCIEMFVVLETDERECRR